MRVIDRKIPTSYEQALDRITRKDGTYLASNLGRNTRLVPGEPIARQYRPARIDVVLYDTPVVTFYADGVVELNSGGYRTATTKARINAALRHSIYRVVAHGDTWHVVSNHSPTWLGPLFRDGYRLRFSVFSL